MLEDDEAIWINHLVHRLANRQEIRAALGDLPISLEDAIETIDFLGATDTADALTLLDAPFRIDSRYRPHPTRFTDGTWRVFYSALEPETVENEVAHWCRKEFQSQPPALRRFHYKHLQCRLDGQAFDVRPRLKNWSFLTGDNTYPECQALAAEAKSRGVDAILCPSARRPGGTTAPVFERRALSDPTIRDGIVLEIEASGEIRIVRA